MLVWVVKRGVDFMRGSWDLCPADLRSGIAQLLLSGKMENGVGSLEVVSGFIPVWNETLVNKVLCFPGKVGMGHLWAGGVVTGLSSGWSRNTPKLSCVPGSVQLCRYCQIKIISVPVSQSVINESQSHWKSGGAFQCVSTNGVWLVLVLKTMTSYCGQNFFHVNAQIPCLLVLTPQCVPQLQCLCWIINILL